MLDPKVILEDDVFDLTQKPRIKKMIYDMVFLKPYKEFELLFRGCHKNFVRSIFANCKFI
jgi:hypothetical protein